MQDNNSSINETGIFGAAPLFAEQLLVGRPNLPPREKIHAMLDEILDSRWLTNNGRMVQQLERRIEELVGVRHCVAMCNGTIALEIAARAANLTGEVIVPSFTFVATAHALQWQQITPVFCDVDPVTHNIDPAQIEALITPKTSAIIATHVWGTLCPIEALEDIARRHNLRLMFDAAHAFGCGDGTRRVGTFGDGEIYSFHATKFMNTFEGGAFVTNDDDLAHKARLMRNFGFAGVDQVIHVGTNGKMSEISAAMGLAMLDELDAIIRSNHEKYRQYREELRDLPGVSVFDLEQQAEHNYQYIILDVDAEQAGLSRDELVAALAHDGVIARRYFYPGCHRMEPYRSLFPMSGRWLPQTELLSTRVMALPTGTAVNADTITQLTGRIKLLLANAEAVRARLLALQSEVRK